LASNGKTIDLSAPANSDANRYVQKLTVNGKAYDKNYFTHEQPMRGVKLNYQMGSTPNKRRGTTPSAYPYSFSDNNE
jgi:putative alpha-1,2-mannosidase